MRPLHVLRLLVPATLLLAGCVTDMYPGSGYPGPAYPGSGYPGQPGGYGQSRQVEGQVLDVDHRNGRFMLGDNRGYGSQRVEVYYDQRTVLDYRGQRLSPQGLEPGDVIRVYGEDAQSGVYASRIDVLRDVRGGGQGQPPYGQQPFGQLSVLDGALRHIDTRNQFISLTRGGYAGPQEQVRYDARTRFEDRGRPLRPEQLRAGDMLRIEARMVSGGWLAERVQVQTSGMGSSR